MAPAPQSHWRGTNVVLRLVQHECRASIELALTRHWCGTNTAVAPVRCRCRASTGAAPAPGSHWRGTNVVLASDQHEPSAGVRALTPGDAALVRHQHPSRTNPMLMLCWYSTSTGLVLQLHCEHTAPVLVWCRDRFSTCVAPTPRLRSWIYAGVARAHATLPVSVWRAHAHRHASFRARLVWCWDQPGLFDKGPDRREW